MQMRGTVLEPGISKKGERISLEEIQAAYDIWTLTMHRRDATVKILDQYLDADGTWKVEMGILICPRCKSTAGWKRILFWRHLHKWRCKRHRLLKNIVKGGVGFSISSRATKRKA